MRFSTCGLLVGLLLGAPVALCTARGQEPQPAADDVQFFEQRIRPVLVEHCYACHSAAAKKLEGSLSLETAQGWKTGGDQGAAIVPGKPEESLLILGLRHTDASFRMPPKQKLPDNVIADFEAWVKRGAVDPRTGGETKYIVDIEAARQRWPFTPISDPAPPDATNRDWPRNDIDRFILAKLESRQLQPVADASREVLLRRVTYDLTGLPPTTSEIDQFLSDTSADAFSKVVERLLASPRYGERWGRHWLDVVRYADTAGDNSDYPIPQMVRYRDWVIDAFNSDMPYDQFVREQLAGDLLPADSPARNYRQTIATGYLANSRRFGSRVDDYPQHLTIEDTIDNLGRAFLGLSINCARCHNHKFDPITNEDYYALYGIFQSTRYPWPGIELDKRQRDLVPLASVEEVARAQGQRQQTRERLECDAKEKTEASEKLEKELRAAERELVEAKKGQDAGLKTSRQAFADEARKKFLTAEDDRKAARNALENHNNAPLPYELAYAVAEAAKIGNAHLQLKGDPEKKGTEVPRRFPQVFGAQRVPTDGGSGRLALAAWITDPQQPLAPRVIVNRIWGHHFGRGLVATPNDFGRQGRPPTHPELLDFLARRFIDDGWSIKNLHRLIVQSRTYQLGSFESEAALRVDPSNELHWRHSRHRMDAEQLRDTLLVLGNNLDLSPAGPHPFPAESTWNFTQHNPFRAVYETNHRSVYLMTQRIQRHPFLSIFDGADTSASTGQRMTSTTTLQALYLLNDPFVHDQIARFTAYVRALHPYDEARLQYAHLAAMGRLPDLEEKRLALEYLARMRIEAGSEEAWQSYLRSLLRTSGFIYIE